MQRTTALMPELADPHGPEVAVSPVRMHRNGLAGEITFRWPPEMSQEEITAVLVKLLSASTSEIPAPESSAF